MTSKMAQTGLPAWRKLLWETLQALREEPMPISVEQASARAADWLELSDEQRSIPSHREGRSLVRYQISHILSRLAAIGALNQPQPRSGLYALTDDGRALTESEVVRRNDSYQLEVDERRRLRKQTSTSEDDSPGPFGSEAPEEMEDSWRQELLERLKTVSPTAFEHLSGALLEAAGFHGVSVTRQSGDGGIDAVAVYRPQGLISFRTAVQCKRWSGGVGPDRVQAFQGASMGKADRGILITTGHFTPAAIAQAQAPGAFPVDLVDGDALCELLREYSLGVRTIERKVKDVMVDQTYFNQFEVSK